MDAIFIDSNGNKKNFLYQYDIGQTFVIENFEYKKAPKAQFSIKSIKTMPSVSSKLIGTNLSVSIPDMLLTYGENIIVYLYIEDSLKGNTVETVFISVIPRKRPADYIYTDEMFARSISGTVISEKSGIAEVAEWEDGNHNSEDRYGYFVSISYDENLVANKATSLDNVYGVSVQEIGFASSCNESQLNTDGTLISKYTYVCTSGFAKVIDNGRCTVGDMCIPGGDGTAIPPTNIVGYKVVDRVDDNHILIFVDPSMQTINNFQTNISGTSDSLNTHINNKSNPHKVTKTHVGLSNVDNTSDADKPVSTATQKALDYLQSQIDNLPTTSGIPFVFGTQTESTSTWTGTTTDISALYDGLCIGYWLPQSSTGVVTLNLTLSDNTSTGDLHCYTGGSSYLKSDISQNTMVLLVYKENVALNNNATVSGWWTIAGGGFYNNADVNEY